MKRYLFILMVLLLAVGCMVIPTAAADPWNAVFTASTSENSASPLIVHPGDIVTITGGFSDAVGVAGYTVTATFEDNQITINNDPTPSMEYSMFAYDRNLGILTAAFNALQTPPQNCFTYTFKVSDEIELDANIQIAFHIEAKVKDNWQESRDVTVTLYLPDAPKPHVHTIEPVSRIAPTCAKSGSEAHFHCTDENCGMLFSDADGKNQIDKPKVISSDISYHSPYTIIINAVKPGVCTPGYSGDEVCDYCRKPISEYGKGTKLPPETHGQVIPVVGKESTCKVEGNKEYYKCLNKECQGLFFSDPEGRNQIKEIPTLAINPNNHPISALIVQGKKDATESEPGYTGDIYCTECKTVVEKGEIIPANAVQIGDTYYGSVSAALTEAKSGDTVVMCADVNEDMVQIPSGVTLDLNGQKLIVSNYFVNFGNVIDGDGTTGSGLLIMGATVNKLWAKTNAQLPVWIAEDGGYRFTTVILNKHKLADTKDEAIAKLQFRPEFGWKDGMKALLLNNGCKDNKITIAAFLSWKSRQNADRDLTFSFSDESVSKVANTVNGALTLTVSGFENFDNVNIAGIVYADFGVAFTATTLLIKE